jgi:hypothetical protein
MDPLILLLHHWFCALHHLYQFYSIVLQDIFLDALPPVEENSTEKHIKETESVFHK